MCVLVTCLCISDISDDHYFNSFYGYWYNALIVVKIDHLRCETDYSQFECIMHFPTISIHLQLWDTFLKHGKLLLRRFSGIWTHIYLCILLSVWWIKAVVYWPLTSCLDRLFGYHPHPNTTCDSAALQWWCHHLPS